MISRMYTTEQSLARFSHSGVACYRREVSDYFALYTKDEMEKPPDPKDQAAGVREDEPPGF